MPTGRNSFGGTSPLLRCGVAAAALGRPETYAHGKQIKPRSPLSPEESKKPPCPPSKRAAEGMEEGGWEGARREWGGDS